MAKLVVLNLLKGDFEQGFPAILEIGEEGSRAALAIRGYLPGTPKISELFCKWQEAFHSKVNQGSSGQSGIRSRITVRKVTKSSCHDAAKELAAYLNDWLKSGGEWQKIRDGLQQHLSKDDEIRVIIQTEDFRLRQLPWQAWEIFTECYNQAEIALSAPEYESPTGKLNSRRQSRVRILAVLGNNDNINIEFDRQVLERLREQGAKIEFLNQPKREELLDRLWDERGWHIFFFAGHSSSQLNGEIGWFNINQDEALEIKELKNALKTAIKGGLQLAIFNSCDGLGLANQLAKLHLPQSIVMREPVPDRMAQEFLQNFLTAFANDRSLYASVREARSKLENWEKEYAGASWLPIICQNPAVLPPCWQDWCSRPLSHLYKIFFLLLVASILSLAITVVKTTVLDKPLCSGSSCIGRDPKDNKCDRDAITVTSRDREISPSVVKVELRYSKRCNSTWLRTTGALVPRVDYLEDSQGKKYPNTPVPHTHPVYYSNMGPGKIEIKACTQLQSGEPKCTGLVNPSL
ncbi:CHAT domain-containing protein [Floridanema aerugineum]|uniref:CHAT domain-containing protein n=1 Tax=Floridaenema aerugineum BLCC-F46 TaxID=3153654 RepID=A0ABV4WXM4_9CYAN